MAQRTAVGSGIENGLNSEVEYGGRSYHVQTQCSNRGAPIIESLAYQGGQMLVRITASYDDVARRLGFNGDDGRHLLELQHADLVQKIRHGMLRDDEVTEAPPETETPHFVDASGMVVDPGQVQEPAVLELLQELGVAIDEARPRSEEAVEAVLGECRPDPDMTLPRRPWWRRIAVCIRLSF